MKKKRSFSHAPCVVAVPLITAVFFLLPRLARKKNGGRFAAWTIPESVRSTLTFVVQYFYFKTPTGAIQASVSAKIPQKTRELDTAVKTGLPEISMYPSR